MSMKNETIVDRVVERLKLQPLGDLITEEDLHDIVKEAIPKTFFAERKNPEYSGGYGRPQYLEPLIQTIMRDLLKDSVTKAVDAWIADNKELLIGKLKEIMDDGIVSHVEKVQREKTISVMRPILQALVEAENARRATMGLPALYI